MFVYFDAVYAMKLNQIFINKISKKPNSLPEVSRQMSESTVKCQNQETEESETMSKSSSISLYTDKKKRCRERVEI